MTLWGHLRGGGLLLFVVGATACAAGSAAFRPADGAGGRRGRAAAAHFAIDVDRERLGVVNVSTDGVAADPDDPKALVITVRLRLQNRSAAPMVLDVARSDLEVMTDERRATLVEEPVSTTGSMTVEPGQVGRLGLRYPVPAGLHVGELAGFDFNFTIRTSKGDFLETASFGRQRADYQGVYFWPMWDPWWWGYPYYPWGWHVGVGVQVQPRYHRDRGGRPPRHRR